MDLLRQHPPITLYQWLLEQVLVSLALQLRGLERGQSVLVSPYPGT
jgi:hypothetical protein